MPGNELEVARYLFNNLNKVNLKHLGVLKEIGAPVKGAKGNYIPIRTAEQVGIVASEDANKKADIYINGIGVSIKQTGGSFPFNRMQRDNIVAVFNNLGFKDAEAKLSRLDKEVDAFHQGLLDTRNRPWRNIFNEDDFKLLLRYLMMQGSPNKGNSSHPAALILEAPKVIQSPQQIHTYTFEEYFAQYSNSLMISIRRQWIGQGSDSEHKRARGLARKNGNLPWVYKDIMGEPSSGWMSGFPSQDRRTVYFLMIEKV